MQQQYIWIIIYINLVIIWLTILNRIRNQNGDYIFKQLQVKNNTKGIFVITSPPQRAQSINQQHNHMLQFHHYELLVIREQQNQKNLTLN
ncbi:hypothetical protein pb186bvf_011891 [Paramecium bursaria]